ncbi:DctP family TRAP transporter solute-binding subunit [Brevibacillus brevis]|uniref:DctP family TRAP transporter solute-binding subunit n=1 Tax=Brevibacillus brevis TaxID=1393 RepID=UPI000D112E59|nr:DctP family TRAP transporter solute-binding subunit [Brevibacillus brevis]PSJ67677.1 C4-dicarboxylate ABC transporter [Brevibacillus brevis]RED28237.1 C4-dicarboxylate-binding protein DctP [Brevibacillus brevis]GEC90522.1 C4-dicarboxylate-binding protein DctB [Brevibacillus brevis]VEF90933.1 C4-dicarboxylate-binding periplasmic protein precursor [Brevibacillus brevis]
MKSLVTSTFIVLLGLVSAVIIGFGSDLLMENKGYDEEQVGLSNQIIIKFSHVIAENTPKGLTIERFSQLVKEKTNGRVEVQVFPNSILHTEKTEMTALQNGEIQMIAPAFSYLSNTIPEWAVLDLPYLFRSQEDVETVFNGEIGQILFDKLEDSDMKGLAFWASGFKQVTANRPLIMPSDFVGQRLRIIPGNVIEAQFRTLQAIPVGSSFNELYSMLAAGKVDGEENTISNVYTKRLYQVQKHMTISNHSYLGYAVVINKTFWNSLPADIQQAISEAMQEATAYNNQLAVSMNDKQLRLLQENGGMHIHMQTAEERAAWIEALQPVYDQFAPSIGEPLMVKIRELHQRR